MDLQELISRGRFVFAGSSERLRLFELIDGKKSADDLARVTRRHVNNVRRDLHTLEDAGLVERRTNRDGTETRSGRMPVFQKIPLARTIPVRYFAGAASKPLVYSAGHKDNKPAKKQRSTKSVALPIPTETEILDLCKNGEDQTHEFKAAGTDARKVTREIAAMLNTRQGGLVFYGVDDDGTIQGSDVTVQKLDQPLQNSIKNSIAPAATVQMRAVAVLGSPVIVIVVPPWNRRDVYQFDEKVLLRKGTNVFGVRPEELKKLHRGEVVI